MRSYIIGINDELLDVIEDGLALRLKKKEW